MPVGFRRRWRREFFKQFAGGRILRAVGIGHTVPLLEAWRDVVFKTIFTQPIFQVLYQPRVVIHDARTIL